ncbi:MAG: GyrI-like domain-containing protein [Anaerolineales bacterium]|nr:GyrI-like domain-containing protein [Anaerolineales bacterium]
MSRVEKDPAERSFYYMIADDVPEGCPDYGLEAYTVTPAQWAVIECIGKAPEAIVKTEMFAFGEWLPCSDFVHAQAPEMEVYFLHSDGLSQDSYCEFWLPIAPKPR